MPCVISSTGWSPVRGIIASAGTCVVEATGCSCVVYSAEISEPSVPRSLPLTGRYCPLGHQAQASSGEQHHGDEGRQPSRTGRSAVFARMLRATRRVMLTIR